ncbi:hypothetical protein [Streptomyces luteireticuli]|uniref:hypothetical protein n=1 Tax=Streptomyces luteireticuli TaxID=173858 RepID=UPI0035564B23
MPYDAYPETAHGRPPTGASVVRNTGSRLSLLGVIASLPSAALAGAPWWTLLLTSLPGAAALLASAVIPQNSHDRLEWWRDRRRHHERLARRSS